MNRRNFIKKSAVLIALPNIILGDEVEKKPIFIDVKVANNIVEYEDRFSNKKDRTFKISLTHHIKNRDEILKFPLPVTTNYQHLISEINSSGNYSDISIDKNILNAKFDNENGEITTKFEIFTSSRYTHFQTINYDKDEKFTPEILKFINLNVDETIKQKANLLAKDLKNDLDKARTIFVWICDNFKWDESELIFKDTNEILNSLKANSLDASMLFVELCNALNIPARAFVGLKIGESTFKESMGCDKSDDISNAHHARVEFYLKGYGWIPCDVADPIKIKKYEEYTKNDAMYKYIRDYLFGTWEMNWMQLNTVIEPLDALIYPSLKNITSNKLNYKYTVKEFNL